jgi:3-methyl-2-oxobutanoate hydroxymethyltransferase
MANYLSTEISKITTNHLIKMKRNNEKIAILTAYDYTTAKILDGAGVDAILVGDSASNVMAGYKTTVPITLDYMIMYAASVVRGVKRAMVICDMPFGTYTNPVDGVRNAIRVMQETQCDALKLEGGVEILDTVREILNAGIPVMGHLGLTPQSINRLGSYAVRAKEEQEAEKLLSDARALDEAGCFGIVLEKIPATLSARVSAEISIPTIGIGGGMCDGQVLVVDDMMGKNKDFNPKFLRVYADLHGIMTDAAARYVADVKSMDFPNDSEHY